MWSRLPLACSLKLSMLARQSAPPAEPFRELQWRPVPLATTQLALQHGSADRVVCTGEILTGNSSLQSIADGAGGVRVKAFYACYEAHLDCSRFVTQQYIGWAENPRSLTELRDHQDLDSCSVHTQNSTMKMPNEACNIRITVFKCEGDCKMKSRHTNVTVVWNHRHFHALCLLNSASKSDKSMLSSISKLAMSPTHASPNRITLFWSRRSSSEGGVRSATLMQDHN